MRTSRCGLRAGRRSAVFSPARSPATNPSITWCTSRVSECCRRGLTTHFETEGTPSMTATWLPTGSGFCRSPPWKEAS